jgi:thiol-disulfide isomerase/thioredoxin
VSRVLQTSGVRSVVVAMLAMSACGTSGTSTTSTTTQPRPPAPTVAVLEHATDMDGVVVGPAETRATVAIVFASWCGHCRNEMRELAVLRADLPDVRFLGVNYKQHEEYDGRGDSAAVRTMVAELAPWLRVVPADEALWTSLGRPPKVPTLYVFDRNGVLAKTYDRRFDALPTFDELERVIDALP